LCCRSMRFSSRRRSVSAIPGLPGSG
jgi:hypothetical protein